MAEPTGRDYRFLASLLESKRSIAILRKDKKKKRKDKSSKGGHYISLIIHSLEPTIPGRGAAPDGTMTLLSTDDLQVGQAGSSGGLPENMFTA